MSVEHGIARVVGRDRGQHVGDAAAPRSGSGCARSNGNHAPATAARPAALSGRRVVPRISQPLAASRLGQHVGRVAEPEQNRVPLTIMPSPIPAGPPASVSPPIELRAEVAHPLGRGKPRQRPDRHARAPAAPRRRAAARPRRARPGIAAVADRDQHVAHEPVAADALDRAAGEPAPEGRIVERGQLGQWRATQVLARLQLQLGRGLGELVPRADGEAIVAAIDAVAHQRRSSTGSCPCARSSGS